VSPEGRVRLELNVPGRHAIANALAALAAASVWDIGAAEAQDVFRSLRAPAMRGELLRFSNGAALINDSYNSSPAALQAMTELLADFITTGDLLLVKGSRGVKMEQIVEALISRHAAAGEITGQEVRH